MKDKEKLIHFCRLLKEYNKRFNLISKKEEQNIESHIKDSIQAVSIIKDNKKVADIGSGNGFPGIILAIKKPFCEFILIESQQKKAKFLAAVVKELGLKNVSVYSGRVEEFARNNRESVDIATARAVAHLAVVLEYSAPLLKVGGLCIAYKGAQAEKEIKEATDAAKILGLKLKEKIPYSIDTKKRFLIVYEKISKTPDKFPRRKGMATKRPILSKVGEEN